MKPAKHSELKLRGWRVGSVAEFLGQAQREELSGSAGNNNRRRLRLCGKERIRSGGKSRQGSVFQKGLGFASGKRHDGGCHGDQRPS